MEFDYTLLFKFWTIIFEKLSIFYFCHILFSIYFLGENGFIKNMVKGFVEVI
jgi:hypothetical protein